MPRPPHATATDLAAHIGLRPFTLAEAAQVGVSRSRVRAAVARGEVMSVRHGQYVVVALDDDLPFDERVRAALAAIPGGTVGYDTAREVRGLPQPFSTTDSSIHLIRPDARFRRHEGIHVHGSPLPPNHIEVVGGIPVTSLARTAVDCCRDLSLPRGLIVMDAALRQATADRVGLAVNDPDMRLAVRDLSHRPTILRPFIDVLRFLSGWPGIIAARQAVNAADPASESPLESISQGVFHEFGIPIPECGVPILGDDGVTYWADKLWREFRVIGECDGAIKYTDRGVLLREKARQEALERAGWVVVRWTWEEITQRPEVVIARIRRALLRQAAA